MIFPLAKNHWLLKKLKNGVLPVVEVVALTVEAEVVASRLLPRTRAEFTEFHESPSCSRIYWKGSQYQEMCRVLEGLGIRHLTTSS